MTKRLLRIILMLIASSHLCSWHVLAQAFTIDQIQSKYGASTGEEPFNRLIRAYLSNIPTFYVNFLFFEPANDSRAVYQCEKLGIHPAQIGSWTEEIRINTDEGYGGCLLRFAIVDPQSQLPQLKMYVDFQPVPTRGKNPPNSGECNPPGKREYIPTKNAPDWNVEPIYLNMDNRDGGCALTFELQNSTDDIELHIKVWPDDVAIHQCPTPTRSERTPSSPDYFVVTRTQKQTIILDTDGQWGGCRMQFRLFKKT